MAAKSAEKPPVTLYTFKVALAGDKSIWRRIEIRSDQTLDDLHEAIFRAFDRDDEHMYSFYLYPPGSPRGRRGRGAREYAHPMCAEDAETFDDSAPRDASATPIADLTLRRGRKFEYLFDYGDSWWHELTVEGADGAPAKERYPRIVEKHGDSPPQYPDIEE
ncbi:MAG TPA: plasmid pRiA4b ORF-3 family protein [Phycisphaerae bacterium]|jgi:hypothetical protein